MHLWLLLCVYTVSGVQISCEPTIAKRYGVPLTYATEYQCRRAAYQYAVMVKNFRVRGGHLVRVKNAKCIKSAREYRIFRNR